MKILALKFVLEANENVPMMCDYENIAFDYGDNAIKAMQLGNVINNTNIEILPIMSVNAGSSGVMKYNCFQYILNRITETVKSQLKSIDGIYLQLHGASFVENIGSGDFYILKEIRKIVGPYLPIVVACDPHGNLKKEYVEQTQLIRSYRNSPHTDVEETNVFVINELIDMINHPVHIHSIYRTLPMILGGEQSVSADEPVRSINIYLNEIERDSRVRSASWHVGYIRHDCPEAGCGIVVVPKTEADQEYCELVADRLAAFVWSKHHEFHYTGETANLLDAINRVLAAKEKPNFITDSGDNVTSGATGENTVILQEFLKIEKLNKKVLFASIHDDKMYDFLNGKSIGDTVQINLGANTTELNLPVSINVKIKEKAIQKGTSLFGEQGNQFGSGVLVSVLDKPIDIIVANSNHPFVERQQVMAFNRDWNDYDIVIVKCGYAFPELVHDGNMSIMALTEGATLQDTARLPFKQIMRPMYPIDKI